MQIIIEHGRDYTNEANPGLVDALKYSGLNHSIDKHMNVHVFGSDQDITEALAILAD